MLNCSGLRWPRASVGQVASRMFRESHFEHFWPLVVWPFPMPHALNQKLHDFSLAGGCRLSQVKHRKDVGWSPFVGRWTTKARTRTCVLASVGHVAPRWRLKAAVELFWPPVAKWLPECSGNLILNTSSLRWPSGFQNVPGISF